jgi:hypothetical protein
MSPSKPPEKKSLKGWRIVLRTQTQRKKRDILPSFVKGEKVPYLLFFRKETKPANNLQATLLPWKPRAG